MKNTHIVTLKVSSKVREAMEETKRRSGNSKDQTIFARSMSVYSYLWQQKEEGAKIIIRDEDGVEKELLLL